MTTGLKHGIDKAKKVIEHAGENVKDFAEDMKNKGVKKVKKVRKAIKNM